MENKINVAELLRKCPEGMELDCILFSRPLKYSGLECPNDNYPIRTVAENGEVFWFTKEGYMHDNMYSKCVIFPKGKTSWEGFVPPCKFKKGDVLISQAGNIVLFSHIDSENFVHYHCIISTSGDFRIAKNTSTGVGDYHNCTLANEHQKQRMYDKIKSAGYKYNQDTNKLEKLPKFKNGDICYIKTRNSGHIFIFNGIEVDGYIKRYANLAENGLYIDNLNIVCNKSVIEEFRYATEEEKEKLFDAIKANGYKWNAETKVLEKLVKPKFKVGDTIQYKDYDYTPSVTIKSVLADRYILNDGTYIEFCAQDNYTLLKFDISTLKPFNKVLVRDSDDGYWSCDLFSHYRGKDNFYAFGCISSNYRYCIPYEENKHLLGTTDDCDDFYKNWED